MGTHLPQTGSSSRPIRFDHFFKRATGYRPHEYQARLACGNRGLQGSTDWLSASSACESMLIDVPTGFGKTSAVVLAWIWNRVLQGYSDWPCRLIYCLPMRTLVEQTRQCACRWLERLELSDEIGLHVLMGGEDSGEWDTHVERNTIIVGTQDMLLSRALNRGFGMSRYRWPIHFGLLNNDCLWVMDEVQLMGPGLWTSAQLDWMRSCRFKSLKPCKTWWMSATMVQEFLETPDRKKATLSCPVNVSPSERDESHEILQARRPCKLWKPRTSARMARSGGAADGPRSPFTRALAEAVTEEHREASLSLIVCNTVKFAQWVYGAIRETYGGPSSVVLLTSRFRAEDRGANQNKLLAFETARKCAVTDGAVSVPGLICVSTQVIEAGIDISARRLWSEVSPWPSVIQRLGRLNRDGRQNLDALAWFWERPRPRRQEKFIGPYEAKSVKLGYDLVRKLITVCQSDGTLSAREALASLCALEETAGSVERALTPQPEPCPRAIDVHGLFSTEPDVFGGFTDVSPFVRSQDKNADVTVFWREWNSAAELRRSVGLIGPPFERRESCAVAAGTLREFLNQRSAWVWDDRIEAWESISSRDIRPGMVVMLRRGNGGYSHELGWTGNAYDRLDHAPSPGEPYETFDDDPNSQSGTWVALADHLKDTEREAKRIVEAVNLDSKFSSAVVYASLEHDIGKAHPKWQGQLPKPMPSEDDIWAKAPYQFAIIGETPSAARKTEAILQTHGVGHSQAEPWGQERGNGKSCVAWQTDSMVYRAALEQIRSVSGIVRAWNVPFRPGCRHEAATALAMWHSYYHRKSAKFPALSIYLSAAHHGKVRTVLTSRSDTGEDVCGIPITTAVLPWNEMALDFACAVDGASGHFSENGETFFFKAPGWTGLVADLLGGWEPKAEPRTSHAVPSGEPTALGPFALAYLEALVRCADERASRG